MPITNKNIKKVGKNKFRVQSPTGTVHAKGTSLKNAKAQQRLLNAIEHNPDFKPRKARRKGAQAQNRARRRHQHKPMFDYSPKMVRGLKGGK